MKPNDKKIEDSLLIDLMEDDLDESLKKDLQLLLKNSKPDLENFSQFSKIKKSIKSNKIQIPQDDKYFENLHLRIMNKIIREEPQSAKIVQLHRFKPVAYAAAAALVLVSAVTLWLSVQQEIRQIRPGKELAFVSSQMDLLRKSANNPESVSETILTNEDRSDFILDSAARHLEGMTDADAKQLIENLNQ